MKSPKQVKRRKMVASLSLKDRENRSKFLIDMAKIPDKT